MGLTPWMPCVSHSDPLKSEQLRLLGGVRGSVLTGEGEGVQLGVSVYRVQDLRPMPRRRHDVPGQHDQAERKVLSP